MSRLVRGLVGGLALVCGLVGCGDDGGDDGSSNGGQGSAQLTFTRDVHPIFVAKCGDSVCHGMAGSALPAHGAQDVAVAYEAVIASSFAGGPVYAEILRRIASDDPFSIMPPQYAGCMGALGQEGCISQAEYDLIEAWVELGHPR